MLRETSRVNEEAQEAVLVRLMEAVGILKGKRITLLGLAFKAGTDDLRGAPALALASRLTEQGAAVIGFDPAAGDEARSVLPELEIARDAYAAVTDANAAVICTRWPVFRELDLLRLAEAMADPLLLDARNLLDPDLARAAGFTYLRTGWAG